MNYPKLIWDLIVVCAGAFMIVVLLLIAYRLGINPAPLATQFNDEVLVLMWASTVFGLLAGKYR